MSCWDNMSADSFGHKEKNCVIGGFLPSQPLTAHLYVNPAMANFWQLLVGGFWFGHFWFGGFWINGFHFDIFWVLL